MQLFIKQRQSAIWSSIGFRLSQFPRSIKAIAVVSAVFSAAYLVGRLFFTSQGTNLILFWLLWVAEFIGWLSFVLFIRDTWGKQLKLETGHVLGRTAILIPTYNESRDVLEPSVIGALQVKDVDEIWILDDGNRSWVRELALAKGVQYVARESHEHAKAGNINNALGQISASFILVLDADHIPKPTIVSELKPYMIDPKVAVAQSPHDFRNLDSAQHFAGHLNEQSLFFDVLLPGRNATQAVFWCGSGALLRLDALRAIGGVQTKTITEDLETSLKLQRAGWRTVYHNKVLLEGLAPANLAGYLLQRYRWARGTIQVLTSHGSPILGRGFSATTRLSYLSNLVYYLVPLQHIFFVIVLTATLFTGLFPVNMNFSWLLMLWAPQLLLSLLVVLGLSEGRQLPFAGSRNAWVSSAIYLRAWIDRLFNRKAKFQVTPKDGIEEGGRANLMLLWLPALASGALLAGILYQSYLLLNLPKLAEDQVETIQPIAIVFAVYELIVLLPVIIKAVLKHQYRSNWRFPVQLEAKVGEHKVEVTDIHLEGLQFEADLTFSEEFFVSDSLELKITLSDQSEAFGNIRLLRVSRDAGAGKVLVGASVIWADDSSRETVIKAAYLKRGS